MNFGGVKPLSYYSATIVSDYVVFMGSTFIFLMFVVRRRCFIGVSEMSAAPARPPHDGILLYERRGKYSWELFVEKIGPILTRLNS